MTSEAIVVDADTDMDNEAPTIESLSTKEKRELVKREKVADLKIAEKAIEKGRTSLAAMQEALYTISTERLYKVATDPLTKKPYSTFRDYCEGKWGFSPQYGNRMVREHRDALLIESGQEPKVKVSRNTAKPLANYDAATKISKAYDGFTHVAARYNERVIEDEKFWNAYEKALATSNAAWYKFFDAFPEPDSLAEEVETETVA